MSNRTDTFNRADTSSAIGTPSDSGAAWTQDAGTWGISSNQAYESSNGTDRFCTLECSSAVVEVQVTLATKGFAPGLVWRATDDQNCFVWNFTNIYRRQSGSYNDIGTRNASAGNGDVMKVTVDASNVITVYKNGSAVGATLSDSFNSSATRHGLNAYISADTRFDDFSIVDNSGGGGGSPIIYYFQQL